MLVLTRKLNQTIRIGDDICVTVLEICKGRVRLAVLAADELPIDRPGRGIADAAAMRQATASQIPKFNRRDALDPPHY